MKKHELSDFIRGWLIGDFEPSVFKTKDFEFAVKIYENGDREKTHMHKKAGELTVIINGKFKMNDKVYQKGDVIWVDPRETVDFKCLEDGTTAVIKIPSVRNDKYICKYKQR